MERANKSGFQPRFRLYEAEPANRLNSICTMFSLSPKPGKRKDQFNPSMHNQQHGPHQVVMALLSLNMKTERSYAVNNKISMPHHPSGSGLSSPQMNCQLSSHSGFHLTESQQSNFPLVHKHRYPTTPPPLKKTL